MINYRETKRSTLKLTVPSFEELYRRLVINEEALTFQRSVDKETDSRVFSILSLMETLGSPLPINIGDIKTEGTVLERRKTLKNLRAKARLAMEEQGTNILYLSFGFIEWKDGKGASAQWLRSPLVLMPAVLTLDTLQSPYKLSRHEDDIVVNPTLAYYFKTEYGIELPPFDAEKNSFEDYFKELEGIADQNGWRIVREANLGLLSFLKITMYNDLLLNEERIRQNPVIRAMAGDTDEVNAIPDEVLNINPDAISTGDCYQVMSADSSQQDAILYSKNRISFVMQGPPGTGKSQTITNIIAEALADGKKILFVSEKMSALQVVYRRLQEAHLADFCLPLHSYKANKSDILQQIGANLSLKHTHVKDTALHNLEELLSIRHELNQYAAELHELQTELNLSCYDVYGKLEELRDAPALSFDIPDVLNVTQADLQRYLRAVKEYALALERMQYRIEGHPWEGIKVYASGYRETERMQKNLEQTAEQLSDLIDMMDTVTEVPALAEAVSFQQIPALAATLEKIGEMPDFPPHWNHGADLCALRNAALDAQANYRRFSELASRIFPIFKETVFDFDYNGWKKGVLDTASELTALPLLEHHSAEDVIRDASLLLDSFLALRDEWMRASQALSAINGLLGLNLTVSVKTVEMLSRLLPLMEDGAVIPEEWFRSGLQEIRNLISEGEANARRMSEYKKTILADWEADVLTMDYAPILMRYKTEYTGFSKNFKSQYKKRQKAASGTRQRLFEKNAG
ncbi:MAG: DUF4011 domain-containing protein [Clostridia bacterium]|nr:DUF4011 domain-containing protein [Clostridia bacterium]